MHFSSYAFYNVNPLDTHHIIQRSLPPTICMFLAFTGGSVLQHFAVVPVTYCNFQILSSVSANFLNEDTNGLIFQIIMCTFPSNGSWTCYTDMNFDVLKIGCWPPYIIVCGWFVVSVSQLEAKLWNSIENNDNADFSKLGPLLLGRL